MLSLSFASAAGFSFYPEGKPAAPSGGPLSLLLQLNAVAAAFPDKQIMISGEWCVLPAIGSGGRVSSQDSQYRRSPSCRDVLPVRRERCWARPRRVPLLACGADGVPARRARPRGWQHHARAGRVVLGRGDSGGLRPRAHRAVGSAVQPHAGVVGGVEVSVVTVGYRKVLLILAHLIITMQGDIDSRSCFVP